MSRYIDADALLSKGPFVVRTNDWGEDFVTVEEINKMPTVDAVPVVRCRECKHQMTCGFVSARPYKLRADWFCADGERRTE